MDPLACNTLESCIVDGVHYHRYQIAGCYREDWFDLDFQQVRNFPVKPDDVFLVTYMRSGTNLAQRIMLALRGDTPITSMSDFRVKFPFLEFRWRGEDGFQRARNLASPRWIKTHLHQRLLPREVFTVKPTLVFIYRNPFDLVVSSYHFYLNLAELKFFLKNNSSFDHHFDRFMAGLNECGDWFEFHKTWFDYLFSAEGRSHCFVRSYEQIVTDKATFIADLARFLGMQPSGDVIDRAMEVSSFEKMKQLSHPVKDYVRKGVIGESDEVLSEEQKALITDKLLDKLHDYIHLFPSQSELSKTKQSKAN